MIYKYYNNLKNVHLFVPKLSCLLIRFNCSQHVQNARQANANANANVNDLIEYHGNWPLAEQLNFIKHMRIITEFISADEEQSLLNEVEPYMQRLRYEFNHWDDAIHGFRETERKHWYPNNRAVMERVQEIAFEGVIMPYVHVLDLAADGVIKPHVDSTRFCGTTIAGISLLTDCVMRLVRTDETKYKQTNASSVDALEKEVQRQQQQQQHAVTEPYRNQPVAVLENNFYADILLPKRSLYIMCDTARYNFTHEVLANGRAKFHGRDIVKARRISIICRNEPYNC